MVMESMGYIPSRFLGQMRDEGKVSLRVFDEGSDEGKA